MAKARSTSSIAWRIEEPAWRGIDLPLLRKAARLSLSEVNRSGELTVLLSSDARLSELNGKFRGKPEPTNVLSFPAAGEKTGYLGDIALAFGVAKQEAVRDGKTLSDHAAHLVVHGILHLLGYDHENERDARVMEGLEVVILKQANIDDPYRAATALEQDAPHG